MKTTISYFKLDYDNYRATILSALMNDNTRYYFDTNILSALFSIHKLAREEIYQWVSKNSDKKHLPNWCYLEYMKRGVTSSGLSEFIPDKLGSLVKELENEIKILSLFIDNSSIQSSNFSNITELFNKANDSKNTLEQIHKIMKKSINRDDVHSEISDVFLSKQLSHEAIKSWDELNKEFAIRTENKVPPGFDESKKNNKIGDFIIWKEILNHQKNQEHPEEHPAIFITNDKKKDWVYAPDKIIISGIEQSNNKRKVKDIVLPIKIADPRLCTEYENKIGSDQFFVLTLNDLINMLLEVTPDDFRNISRSLTTEVIDTEEEEEEEEDNSPENNDSENQINTANRSSKYIEEAIVDAKYLPDDSRLIGRIISKLKSHNWYTQSDGIDLILNNIQELKLADKNSLFVLGRNIYQTACGNERGAVQYMRDLKLNLIHFGEDGENHIFAGMLFELYFNKFGEFRDEFKSQFLTKLFVLTKDYPKVVDFIEKELKPYKKLLFTLPSDGLKKKKFKLGGEIKEEVLFVDSLIFNTDNLLIEKGENAIWDIKYNYYSLFYQTSKFKISEVLEKLFAIPSNCVEVEYETSINEESFKYIRIKERYGLNMELPKFKRA